MTIDTTRLRQLAVNDSGFVFDPLTGHTFTVNASGQRVLALLKEGHDSDSIAGRLGDEFELEGGDDLRRDVDDFLARLREHGLVG
jgi:PqqD family protein of HPr-rel-A system